MATDAEKALGEIMGQQDAFATLLAQLFIKYAPAYFEKKKASEEKKKSS